ncbi:MAG TPA: hypothetical protein DIU00_17725 [Phycisphaerales bacterium]|nr:hypothetical protein [Phycisphaerales bacterium]
MSDRKSDSKNLPACAVEYVRRLLKKMRYRRKVRDDVEAELKAHFEDELKDCKSDKERQQRARYLVADFGDMKLLAILLRRAKKRCRPLWRTVIARTFQAIGVLILCFIVYAVWFSFGEPTIRVDYIRLLNQMNQPQLLDQDNAWPHYEKAIKLFVPQSPLVEKVISYRHHSGDREDAMRLKKMLLDNESQIQLWFEKNQKYWDNLTHEQQTVLLKCLEYNWVPFPIIAYQSPNDWRTTTLVRMTEHIIRCIKEDTELTTPTSSGTLSLSSAPEYPSDELKRWIENNTIPPNHLQAVSVAVLNEAIKRFKNLPEDISAPLTEIECEYIRPWIEQNEAAWQQYAAGSAKSYCYRPYTFDPNVQDYSIMNILMPHLAPLRRLVMMSVWHARINRDQGQLKQSIEDCLTIVRSARHWQNKGSIIEQLVSQGISNLGHEEILNILSDRKLSTAELLKLQEQLSQIYPGDYPLMNLEGERLVFMDVIQRSFTDGGPGGGHLIPGMWDEYTGYLALDSDDRDKRIFMPFLTAASMVHARRDATIAKANEIYDLQSKTTKMTPYERHVSNIKAVDEYESMHSYRFFMIQILMPATGRASELAYRGKIHHEATLTILALLRWRQENNQYPAALDELVAAGLLKEPPVDPYSDKPLVYKKTNGDFTLYSVGPNFKDDTGEIAIKHNRPYKWGTDEDGDIVFWPVAKSMPR